MAHGLTAPVGKADGLHKRHGPGIDGEVDASAIAPAPRKTIRAFVAIPAIPSIWSAYPAGTAASAIPTAASFAPIAAVCLDQKRAPSPIDAIKALLSAIGHLDLKLIGVAWNQGYPCPHIVTALS